MLSANNLESGVSESPKAVLSKPAADVEFEEWILKLLTNMVNKHVIIVTQVLRKRETSLHVSSSTYEEGVAEFI